MRCYIAGAGEFCGDMLPGRNDYVIAADAGYTGLIRHGIMPDLVIGDFDSLGAAPDHPNILRIPVEKDDTDMMLAVKLGMERGYTTFIINGGLGGRPDLTYANIQMLSFISRRGARGVLLGRDMCMTAVTDGSISFLPSGTGLVSVFCAGNEAEGVTLKGLKYALEHATLTFGFPLGVSNEFTGAPAMITVDNGTLIVMWAGGIDRLMLP